VITTEVAGEVARIGQSDADPDIGDAERRAPEQRAREFQPQFPEVANRRAADVVAKQVSEPRRRKACVPGQPVHGELVAHGGAHLANCLLDSGIHRPRRLSKHAPGIGEWAGMHAQSSILQRELGGFERRRAVATDAVRHRSRPHLVR
jgi:hypothetical protein